MKIAIRILMTLWMSTLCFSSFAAVVGGLAGGTTASASMEGVNVAANKKKPADKKSEKKRKQTSPLPQAAPAPQLTPEQQRKYDYYYLEACRLKLKKDYDASMELIEHCLDINPCAPTALYEQTQYYLYLKQVDRAVASLEKAVRYAPDNYWYSQALSNLYMQQDSVAKAADFLEQMSLRFSDKLDPLYSLLDIYNRQENYPQVITTLDRIEDRIGKNEQITMEKFRIYLQMGDNKRAFREIESLVAEYPKDYRYQVVLGDAFLQNGKEKQAYDIYQKVLAEEPDNVMALYSLASYYEQTGQKELYEQQLDTLLLNKKVEEATKLTVMRQLIVENEQQGGDSCRIISLFDRILEQEPDDPQLPLLYAQYLVSKNMTTQAVPVLRKVLELDPTNTAARMTLLGEAVKKEDYADVTKLCEGGVEANPDRLEFYYYLAISYNQAERTDDVLDICRRALKQVTPQSNLQVVSDFYAIIGDACYSKGNPAEAFAAYDSSLVYYPDNMGVLNNYAYYLSLERQQLDKAEEMSFRTIKAEPANATYLDTYAWILFEKGNYAEARIYIEEAMKNEGGDSAGIIEHGGDICYMVGDVDRALELWKLAKEKGINTKTLDEKIKQKKYIPNDEPTTTP